MENTSPSLGQDTHKLVCEILGALIPSLPVTFNFLSGNAHLLSTGLVSELLGAERWNHEDAITKDVIKRKQHQVHLVTFHAGWHRSQVITSRFWHNLMDHFFVDVDKSHLFVNISLGWKITALVILFTRRLQHLSIRAGGFGSRMPLATRGWRVPHFQARESRKKNLHLWLESWVGFQMQVIPFKVWKEMLTRWKFSDHHKIWSPPRTKIHKSLHKSLLRFYQIHSFSSPRPSFSSQWIWTSSSEPHYGNQQPQPPTFQRKAKNLMNHWHR